MTARRATWRGGRDAAIYHAIMTFGTILPPPPPRLPGHLAALAIAAVCAACGTASRSGAPAGAEPAPAAAGGDPVAARVRADSARRPYTEADIRFMSHMIHHHSQALVMAGWAPTHGASPAVRRLAERIVASQEDEIAAMRRWLEDRGQAVGHAGHGAPMPGMLTDAQLRELDGVRDEAFDRLFLTYMLQHHRGAVAMVRDLFATPGAAQDESVFKLANDVSADQSSEIARMEAMLATHILETRAQ